MNVIRSFMDWNVQTRDRAYHGPLICTPSAFYAVEKSVRESSWTVYFKRTALTPLGRFGVVILNEEECEAAAEMAVINELRSSYVVDGHGVVFINGNEDDDLEGYDAWEDFIGEEISEKLFLDELTFDYGVSLELYKNDDSTYSIVILNDRTNTHGYWPSISMFTANLLIEDLMRQVASHDEVAEYKDSLLS